MKKITYEAVRFDCGEGVYVEITPAVSNGRISYDFHVCKDGYGVKEHLFGLPAENNCHEMWEVMILNNMDNVMEIASRMQ